MAASPPNNLAHTQRPSLPIIPLSRCPRVCGDPSSPHHSPPKHHSERSEAVPRNLVARFRPFMLFPPHPIPPPRCSRAEPATVKTGGGNPSFLLTFTPAMPPPPNNHAHTQRPSPIRCPRACGDPSSPHHSPPKHHSERSEAVPRNLAAGSHTPLKPECRRGSLVGARSSATPSFAPYLPSFPRSAYPSCPRACGDPSPSLSRFSRTPNVIPSEANSPTCHSERSAAESRNLVVVAISCSPHLPLPEGAVREPPVPTHALPVIPAPISAVPTQSLPP